MAQVLVIDDIEFVRATIRKILNRNGYKVHEATDGRDGLTLFKKYNHDLVLTDILMPEMEGLETIRTLKQISPNLPIIAITGDQDAPFLKMALKFGASQGLFKPFKQHELLEVVHSCLPNFI